MEEDCNEEESFERTSGRCYGSRYGGLRKRRQSGDKWKKHICIIRKSVSYTHLDVYKRQAGELGKSPQQIFMAFNNADIRFGTVVDEEEMCIRDRMELLGHNFFVFRNAESGEVNVVYKRKGDTYGLIEPEC